MEPVETPRADLGNAPTSLVELVETPQAGLGNAPAPLVEPVETPRAGLGNAPTSLVELVETPEAGLRMPRQRHPRTSPGLDKLDQRMGSRPAGSREPAS